MILKQISIIITIGRPVTFPLCDRYLFQLPPVSNYFSKLLYSPNRDQTSIIHLPRSLPILKRSSHCHSCKVILRFTDSQFHSLLLIHPPRGFCLIVFSDSGLLRLLLIQTMTAGRITVTSRRSPIFPTDNVYRSRIGDGYHTPAEGHTRRRASCERDKRTRDTSCR